MKILITYETTSFHGFPVQHCTIQPSLEAAEAVCKLIESCGYKITDVTRDPYDE